jgi:hypothetical protein
MDYVVEQHLKNGQPLALEGNYSPTLVSEKFRKWQKTYDCHIVQIICRTEVNALAQRYFDRQYKDRHPGHNDTGTVEEYILNFHQRIENKEDQPLDVDGPVRIVDTTDFSTVGASETIRWIQSNITG